MNKSILLLLLCVYNWGLDAQVVRRDIHLWTSVEINRKLTSKAEVSFQFQNRIDRRLNRLRGNYFSIDYSHKLRNGFKLLTDVRFATSARWDKYRIGVGIQKNFKLDTKGKNEIKLRALYQYQFFQNALPRFGIDFPQQNFRFRASFSKKIIKKTTLIIESEPMWRYEGNDFFFRRIRSSISVKKSLPGPWTLETGYTRQFNFNNRADFQIVFASLSYEWGKKNKKSKAKEKKKQIQSSD